MNVAVLDLKVAGVAEYYTTILSDKLRTELSQVRIYKVINRENMAAVMGEQGFQASGACNTDACVAEIGKVLGVEKMIMGSVGKLSQTFVLTIKQIDVESGANEKLITKQAKGSEDLLLDLIVEAVVELKNLSKEKQLAILKQDLGKIDYKIDNAIIVLNGKAADLSNLLNQQQMLADRKKQIEKNIASGNQEKEIAGVIFNKKSQAAEIDRQLSAAQSDLEQRENDLTKLDKDKQAIASRQKNIENNLDLLSEIYTPKNTLIRSSYCPGLGQFKSGRKWQGITYGTLVFAGLGWYVASVGSYNSKVDDYDAALKDFNTAPTTDKLKKLKSLKTDADDAKTTPYMALGLVAGAYIWNLVDAYLFTPEDPRLKQLVIQPGFMVDPNSKLTAGLNFNF